MSPPPSYSVTPGDVGRTRILSLGALLGMVALAVGALVLVFPKADLMSLLRSEIDRGNSDLTIAYLQNIIATEPKDLALRLLLIEKLLAANQLDAARIALVNSLPLARSTTAGQISWDRWDLIWWQARLRAAQKAHDGTLLAAAANELMTHLTRHLDSASTSEEVFFSIQVARELGAVGADTANSALMAPAVAVQKQLLARLLALTNTTAADLSRGASLALADGHFVSASELFFAARQKTAAPDARYKLLQQGVQALLASGDSKAAWQVAMKQSQPLPAADFSYWWLATLALGAGEPKEAGLALRQLIPPNASVAVLAKNLSIEQLQLAWDTFAAAGDLLDALKTAEIALLLQPDNAIWLERKAQASEWTGMAPQALKTWLALVERGGSERALASVFRLGPMLYDDDALLVAWLALARQRALTKEEVVKVVAVYERLGSVQDALVFVAALRHKAPVGGADTAHWISLQAQLLDRAGRPNEAISLLESGRAKGLGSSDAIRLARLHVGQAQLPLALRALQGAQLEVTGTFNAEYWGLLADIAYNAGNYAVAETALDALLANSSPASYQAERAVRLRLTDGQDTPRNARALQLAASLYARFPSDNLVFAWLDAVSNQKTPTGLNALLSTLQPAHRRALETSPTFLAQRGGLYARLGSSSDVLLAQQDYQRSLGLRPDNAPTRSAYWWLLLDLQDSRALRRELAQADRSVLKNPSYADVLSAAWQQLDEPRRALALLQPLARTRSQDFLWLMTYADVLDRSGYAPAALRTRRHAWLLLGQQTARNAAKPFNAERARQALLTQLRLASDFAGGEEKARMWRALGRLATRTTDPIEKRQTDELVAVWLLSEGRFDTAQRWLWQQQAVRVTTSAYQAMAVALSQNDQQTMARLLDEAEASTTRMLNPQDRITALRQLNRRDEATTLGMEFALRSPEGPIDDLQQALQEDLLATTSRTGLQTTSRQAGVLSRRETLASAAVSVAPNLKLTAELNSGAYRSRDTSVLAATPAHDHEAKLGFEAATPWGIVTAQALRRDALTTVNGLYLHVAHQPTERSTLQLTLARHERSDESSAMSAVGMRNRAAASLSLRAGNGLDGQLSLGASTFRTQTGAALGSSLDTALNGNWTLRRDYPDMRLQTQWRRSVVRADGQPDAATALLQSGGGTPGVSLFLGPSSTTFSTGVGVGLAQSDPNVYSRAWRPWGEVGLETRFASKGRQTHGLLRLGIKGAVTGRDQLSINFDMRPGTGGLSSADGTSELRVKYELFFDR